MPTPNVDSGVVERNKPLRYASNVVYRREQLMARGATIFTPVFDCLADGFPLTDLELLFLNVSQVTVPSPYLRLTVSLSVGAANGNPGGTVFVYEIQDGGTILPTLKFWVQPQHVTGAPANNFSTRRFEMQGRRCMFAIQNTGLGPRIPAIQTYRVEVLAEG